jgi:peroxiredoxin
MEKHNDLRISNWVNERLAILGPSREWQPNAGRGLARFRARQGLNRPLRRGVVWAAVAVAGLALCVAVLPQPRVLAYRCLDCSVALWQSLSASNPVHANVKPEKGRKIAPDFASADASDEPVKLSDFRGKVVLLNFWATWCGGCQVEIPWFIEFQNKYKDNGFAVIGVSLDADGWKSVKPYVREKAVNYPVVIGSRDVAQFYRVAAMPVTLLIDREGRIAASHVGLVSKSNYKAEVETLLNERASSTESPLK